MISTSYNQYTKNTGQKYKKYTQEDYEQYLPKYTRNDIDFPIFLEDINMGYDKFRPGQFITKPNTDYKYPSYHIRYKEFLRNKFKERGRDEKHKYNRDPVGYIKENHKQKNYFSTKRQKLDSTFDYWKKPKQSDILNYYENSWNTAPQLPHGKGLDTLNKGPLLFKQGLYRTKYRTPEEIEENVADFKKGMKYNASRLKKMTGPMSVYTYENLFSTKRTKSKKKKKFSNVL